MKNKILVEIDIPHLDEKYNIYLPLNKNVADILTLLSKALKDVNLLYKLDFDNCQLYNSDTGILEILLLENQILEMVLNL